MSIVHTTLSRTIGRGRKKKKQEPKTDRQAVTVLGHTVHLDQHIVHPSSFESECQISIRYLLARRAADLIPRLVDTVAHKADIPRVWAGQSSDCSAISTTVRQFPPALSRERMDASLLSCYATRFWFKNKRECGRFYTDLVQEQILDDWGIKSTTNYRETSSHSLTISLHRCRRAIEMFAEADFSWYYHPPMN